MYCLSPSADDDEEFSAGGHGEEKNQLQWNVIENRL